MRVRFAVVVVALVAAVSGCGAAEPEVPAGELRIATGSPGGVYYTYGQAIADAVRLRVPALRPSVLVTDASAANVRMVAAGDAEVGFTQADIAADAIAIGASVVALARVYDDYLHLVVRADGPVHGLGDLRRKRVSIGAAGSGTLITVTRLLAVAGLDPGRDLTAERLNLDQSAAALREGRIDAFFFSGGLPVGAVLALKEQMPIRLVDIGGAAAELRRAHGPFYAEHTVPASAYGLPAVTTIGIPNYLVVSASMPEVVGYAIIRALFAERPALGRAHPAGSRLNAREAINTYPVPLHAGAERWYREEKL